MVVIHTKDSKVIKAQPYAIGRCESGPFQGCMVVAQGTITSGGVTKQFSKDKYIPPGNLALVEDERTREEIKKVGLSTSLQYLLASADINMGVSSGNYFILQPDKKGYKLNRVTGFDVDINFAIITPEFGPAIEVDDIRDKVLLYVDPENLVFKPVLLKDVPV